jgi:TRAP-type C4-dicarboxylate transport system permease small subunit
MYLFTGVIIFLALTGLRFLKKSRPKLARQILRIFLYSFVAIFSLSVSYYFGRLNATSEIQYSTYKPNFDKIIEVAKAYNDNIFVNIFIYFTFTLLTIFIFYFSFKIFDNPWKSENLKHNNSSRKIDL